MEGSYREKYSFVGEWYDSQACATRRYNIFYYPTDDTLEMFDLKTRKTFLRRIKVNGISLDKFFIGGTLNILGRLINIVDFASEDTRNKLYKDMELTFAIIKPIPTNIVGKILSYLNEHGLTVTKIRKVRPTSDDIRFLLRHMKNDPTYAFLFDHLQEQLIYGMELVGKDAVGVCIQCLGDQDPLKAAPGTIRALYGTDSMRNCMMSSQKPEHVIEDLEYFFPTGPSHELRLRLTATLANCTLCIVKPHALREGKLGAALEIIDNGGFNVTALNMLFVELVNAAEFYEVYKGLVPEYKGMMEELASGPCVAMELQVKDKSLNTAVEFRKLVGPCDPEIARLLRPHTLRAKLGVNKVRNAIHCSDLPEDGLLEVEYFFKILA